MICWNKLWESSEKGAMMTWRNSSVKLATYTFKTGKCQCKKLSCEHVDSHWKTVPEAQCLFQQMKIQLDWASHCHKFKQKQRKMAQMRTSGRQTNMTNILLGPRLTSLKWCALQHFCLTSDFCQGKRDKMQWTSKIRMCSNWAMTLVLSKGGPEGNVQ